MTPDAAIDVLARAAVSWYVRDQLGEAWEAYFEDIGEYDFEAIVEHAKALYPEPEPAQFVEAYALLAARCDP